MSEIEITIIALKSHFEDQRSSHSYAPGISQMQFLILDFKLIQMLQGRFCMEFCNSMKGNLKSMALYLLHSSFILRISSSGYLRTSSNQSLKTVQLCSVYMQAIEWLSPQVCSSHIYERSRIGVKNNEIKFKSKLYPNKGKVKMGKAFCC